MPLPPITARDGGWLMGGARHERRKLLAIALLSSMIASPAWELFKTNKDLISMAKITMEEALRSAAKAVPSGTGSGG